MTGQLVLDDLKAKREAVRSRVNQMTPGWRVLFERAKSKDLAKVGVGVDGAGEQVGGEMGGERGGVEGG